MKKEITFKKILDGRYFSTIFFISIMLGTAACQTTKEIHLKSILNETEFKDALEATGKNTVKGSAMIRLNNGSIQTCAGFSVSLIPVTEYSSERIHGLYGNTDKGFSPLKNKEIVKFVPDSKSYSVLARQTTCNPQGFFSFEKIKDGSYFVITSIQWVAMDGLVASNHVYGGGSLFQKVTVNNKEITEIVLSP